jgi:branched-chain amino acid transport system substrate-binding protein
MRHLLISQITRCFASLAALIFSFNVIEAYSDNPPTYKIGVSLPLSGDLAQYGSAVRNGINLARARFPEKFKGIEFSYEDNRYDAKTSLSVLRKFQTKNVDLLYSWGEVPFNAIATTADKECLPLAAYSLDNTLAKGSRCIILTSNDPHTLTAPLVRALRKRGAKRFAVVKMEDPYINAVIDGFRSNLHESEELLTLSLALPGEFDMRSHALRAKAATFDALGVYLYPGQISEFYRQMKMLKLTHFSFGTDIFENPSEVKSSGGAMEGAIYPNFSMPEWFPAEYRARFSDEAQMSYAYNSYAWAVIAAHALSSHPRKLTSREIVDKLKSVTGSEGDVRFAPRLSSDGVFYYEFPIVIRKIVSNGFETVAID